MPYWHRIFIDEKRKEPPTRMRCDPFLAGKAADGLVGTESAPAACHWAEKQ